jgi:SprT protein
MHKLRHSGIDRKDSEIRSAIEAAVARCLTRSAALGHRHGVRLPSPEVRFDLRGLAAGQFLWHRGKPPVLRFNLAIARQQPRSFIAATVAHEVAHLVTACCHGRVAPHGPEWRSTMHHLGIRSPSRCHNYLVDETLVRRQSRWPYVCDCRQHELSTTRHNRVQRNLARYHCRHCGGPLRFDHAAARDSEAGTREIEAE